MDYIDGILANQKPLIDIGKNLVFMFKSSTDRLNIHTKCMSRNFKKIPKPGVPQNPSRRNTAPRGTIFHGNSPSRGEELSIL